MSRDDAECSAEVLFHIEEKIGVKILRTLLDTIQSSPGKKSIILVSSEGPTPFTKKELVSVPQIETFQYKELVLNITRCKMTPLHERLTTQEAECVLQKYNVKKDDLPRIPITDPVIKYYNFPMDSIVRISRNINATPSVYYRRVVSL